jgi:tetratricopeptide (TPR) repeat protein
MADESVESLLQRARECMEQRNWDRARQVYLQALGLRADSADVHYGLATVCFQLRDLNSAAHHFREVTRLDPLRAGAYINLGAVYNLLDQLDEAVTALRRGIQLDSHRAEGYYNLGLVYRRKGQPELALQAYREAIRVNPRMGDAHYNLGNLYLEKEEPSLAVAHYKSALELRPAWDKAQHGLDQAQAMLHPKEAAKAGAGGGAKKPDSSPKVPALDPERLVDPNIHGSLLTTMHKTSVDADSHARQFLELLEGEVEPVIKELSTCLLYPDGSVNELDQVVQKFENAINHMQAVQRALQTSMDKIRTTGDRMLKV